MCVYMCCGGIRHFCGETEQRKVYGKAVFQDPLSSICLPITGAVYIYIALEPHCNLSCSGLSETLLLSNIKFMFM